MSKRSFKPGDRVKVYGPVYQHPGIGTQNGRLVCEVLNRYSDSCNFVCKVLKYKRFGIPDIEVGAIIYCHEKQLRRIVPKKKPEPKTPKRVERWLTIYNGRENEGRTAYALKELCMAAAEKTQPRRTAHLVELKPGEQIIPQGEVGVSREKLEKEWQELRNDLGMLPPRGDASFHRLCTRLGLPDGRGE